MTTNYVYMYGAFVLACHMFRLLPHMTIIIKNTGADSNKSNTRAKNNHLRTLRTILQSISGITYMGHKKDASLHFNECKFVSCLVVIRPTFVGARKNSQLTFFSIQS